jgi:hypothetical protein
MDPSKKSIGSSSRPPPSHLPGRENVPMQSSQRARNLIHARPAKFVSIGLTGPGSRHVHDHAPFSLWDAATHSFRQPTEDEVAWIRDTFDADEIQFGGTPDLIIKTAKFPDPLPVTVGGMMAHFISPGKELYLIPKTWTQPYGSSKMRDLITDKIEKYRFPTEAQVDLIATALESICDFRSLSFSPPAIIVNLDTSTGRTYDRFSLLVTAGGCMLVWHEGEEDYFQKKPSIGIKRIIEPKQGKKDETDYLEVEPSTLYPGVCLSSARLGRVK